MESIMKSGYTSLNTPIGCLRIKGIEQAIVAIDFIEEEHVKGDEGASLEVLQNCKQQLTEYFQGQRKVFDIPVLMEGTAFQQKVWKVLFTIPFGKTSSYIQVARSLGDSKSVRAVGNANGKNPVPVIIPCHRVIGADGSLVGYAGGQWRKKWLLDHEQKIISGQLEIF